MRPPIEDPAMTNADPYPDFHFGTFDNSVWLTSEPSHTDFFITQNNYLQGFLPVLLASLYATTGQRLRDFYIETGPEFVAKPRKSEEELYVQQNWPVCECRWPGPGEEEKDIQCIDFVDTAGNVPCRDVRQMNVVVFLSSHRPIHSVNDNQMQKFALAGVYQAAQDLRLVDWDDSHVEEKFEKYFGYLH